MTNKAAIYSGGLGKLGSLKWIHKNMVLCNLPNEALKSNRIPLASVSRYSWFPLFVFLFFDNFQSISQIKIYVNTDLEGISGVYKFAQTREKNTPLNIQACEYFMDDLAAVIRGLRDGGATEILVLDGHGNQAVVPHMMVPGVKYITGKPRPRHNGTMYGLDSTFSGMVFVGFHAMNGTSDGVLNHTQSSVAEKRYWYNGIESGELVQDGAVAGYFGVPPIMVSGDVATCREAKRFFGENCVTVAVKEGIARESAILYPFEETRQALYEGAKRAVEGIDKCKPFLLDLPIKGKIEYLEFDSALPEPKLITKEAIFNDALHMLDF
ncbi:MAG: M55 family metallopeptidase [Bacteroidetes bacterium]|nr:M55 family metallopeptidase [Bacteroidota bacterium]MDA1120957.1 M55 family metallopeptidase [Bacteroidota bacterium]